MYKIITSLFLQGYSQTKSSLKECLINGQFCKNKSLKLDNTSRQHTFVFQKIQETCLDLLEKYLATSSSHRICIHDENSVFHWFSFKYHFPKKIEYFKNI